MTEAATLRESRRRLAIDGLGIIASAAGFGFVFGLAAAEAGFSLIEAMAFSVIVFSEVFRSFASRSSTRVLWEVGAFSNVVLLAVVFLSVAAQLAIVFIPTTQALFHIVALPPGDTVLSLALGLVSVTVLEVRKLILRRRPSP